jgi:large subunit ribosomal protein LP1
MVSKAEHDEMCCVYAALLLFDDKVEITADRLNKVITASGNTVEGYYPEFFAKYLSSVDLNSFLNNVGSAAPAGIASTAAPAAAAEAPAKADPSKKFLFFNKF